MVDPGPNTLVGPGCESAETSDAFTTIGLALPQSSPRAPILSLHRFECLDRPCAIAMSIVADGGRFKGRLLASRRVAIRRPRQKLPKQLGLRLNARGVQLVRRAGPVRARIRVVIDDAGDITRGTFVVILGRG
jgi:hypothetical protein